ncbi:MAG: S-methyl-5'-thioinosine phosphorylase [Burkholderiaceae bacterium]
MKAIIGGSGLGQIPQLRLTRREVVRTPFGDPSCALSFGVLGESEVVFLARHGYGHTLAPHQINYRANLWALHEVGADAILSVAAVGGIRNDLGPGTLVVPDQLIDYTFGRASTFFEGPDNPVTHVDFTRPYDEALRQQIVAGSAAVGEKLILGGTYGCTQGPRLETAAEIRRMRQDGCDLVGMTGMPEAVLARELGVPYATLAVVANAAAGVGQSQEAISMSEIRATLDLAMARVCVILRAWLAGRD